MLTPGEIVPGMMITVLKWNPRPTKEHTAHPENPYVQTMVEVDHYSGCRSHVGDVLKAIAIDLPFIVVERLQSKDGYMFKDQVKTFSLDSREMVFKELKKEYVDAMTRNAQR